MECIHDTNADFILQVIYNSIWDKRLKEHGNKTKTKKTMAQLSARFEKANPPRSAQDTKARWHSRSRHD